MSTNNLTPAQAKAAGYCIVSRKAPTWAARIDRPDWHSMLPGHRTTISRGDGDLFRRLFSKDVITVPPSWIKLLPNSNNGPDKFLPK